MPSKLKTGKTQKENQEKPLVHLADAINRSMIGDPRELTKGSGLTRFITVLVFIVIGFLLYRLS